MKDRHSASETEERSTSRSERSQQSIKLPHHLRRRLRLAAVFLDRQISEMVTEAVTRYLDDIARERKDQRLPPIPQPQPERDA